jgi:hypothetical protein
MPIRCRTTASKKRRQRVKWERRHKTHKPISLMLMGLTGPNKKKKQAAS